MARECDAGVAAAETSAPRPHHFDFPLAQLRQGLMDQRFELSLNNVRIVLAHEQRRRLRWDREEPVPDRDPKGRQGFGYGVHGHEMVVQSLHLQLINSGLRLEPPGSGRSVPYPRRPRDSIRGWPPVPRSAWWALCELAGSLPSKDRQALSAGLAWPLGQRRLSASSIVRSGLSLLFEKFPRLLGRFENMRRGVPTEGLTQFHPQKC
jgi:hypothetical protein